MKKILLTLFVTPFFLLGCGSGSQHGMKTESSKALDVTPNKLSITLDPVCQMNMEKIPIADTMTYNGKLYGFCHPGCREAFSAEPEKFLSELP